MRSLILLAPLLLAGCSAASAALPVNETVVTLIATAEIKGTPEPCGCSSDPLGDVARVATLAKGGLWVDAGSLLYDPERLAADKRAQADATAVTLARILSRADVGLGADDLTRGRERVQPPRVACNVRGVPLSAPRVHEIGGARIGVFAVAAPERLKQRGVRAKPPVPAALAAVAELKKHGAQTIVALCAMNRVETRALVKAVPGIHIAVVGAEVGDGMPEPEPVGEAYLVAPADQARYVAHLELHLKRNEGAPAKLQLHAGPAALAREHERIAHRIATLEQSLTEWRKDAHADAAFVSARAAELQELRVAEQRLTSGPQATPDGSYFTYELVPVRVAVARDPEIAGSLRELARTIGRENLRAAQAQPPPPADPDAPSYVGSAACGKCHPTQVEFWRHTPHAHAWQSLTSVDKQYNYDCIGCHTTGFGRTGGPNLATVEKRGLTDVQCEVCHGPGSEHVSQAGLDEPLTLTRRPADRFCADNCHTKEQSDTFELVPYLRDILGKGHGEKARAALGEGVTAHELRQKALEKAGRN
jgi:hypothetical protein